MSNFIETEDAPKTFETPYIVDLDTDFIGRIDRSKDIDAIRFSVTEAGSYAISITGREVEGESALGSARAAVRREDGETVAFYNDSFLTPDQLSFTAEAPGDYLIRLGGEFRFGYVLGNYRISASTITVNETSDAPANATSPYEVTPSTSFTGTLDATDRKDWIKVELVEGQIYAFDIDRFGDWQHEFFPENLSIFNQKGNPAGIVQLNNRSDELVFQAERTGTHFIQIKPDNSQKGDNIYRLNMTELMLDETEDAPSDGNTPYSITAGESFTGALTRSDDRDKINIDLEAGQVYRFFVDDEDLPRNATLNRHLLQLRNEAGEIVAEASQGGGYSGSGPGRITFFAEETGTYSLTLSTNRGKGLYEINTRILPGEGDTGEVAGDDSSQVTLDQNSNFFAAIDPGGDQDWFRVSLSAGKNSDFFTSEADGVLDTVLTLYASDGTILAQSDDNFENFRGVSSRFVYAPETDMDAFLAVSTPGGLVSGRYQVSHNVLSNNGELRGSVSDDVLRLTGEEQRTSGLAGDDLIYGSSGEDLILAGDGDDIVYGYGGRDTLYSGTGFDQLFGGAGKDRLFIDDNLFGTVEAHGGAGRDKFVVRQSSVAEIFGDAGRDRIEISNSSNVTATGGAGADAFVMRLSSFARSDTQLTITDFELGKDKLKLSKNLIVDTELEAHIRAFGSVDTDSITLDFKYDSSVVFEGITDLDALIADTVLL